MSVRTGRVIQAKKIRTEEIIVDFDANRLKAPFLLRCGAILIDYILLVSVPVISLIIYRMMGDEPLKILNNKITNAGWLIMILLTLTNFVILPMFSGKTIGKILTGTRIVKTDGNAPSVGTLLLRHLIGYPLTILTLGVGFLFSVLTREGRALHDFLAGTVVIYGRRQVKIIKN
ncbi:MAG: RDD family protein [Acidobacteria bacterium]|nr:RDD family protein [Acidobacteriota bacterium]MCA1638885.1 RDD family protein [Acidobacteriota bacterium]